MFVAVTQWGNGAIFETMKLYVYLSSAAVGDMLGYLRNEICTMHMFLQENMTMLKQNSLNHIQKWWILYFSLQHCQIFLQKHVHRTYLIAYISKHISETIRGQVFVKFYCFKNSITSSLSYGDEHRRHPTQGLLGPTHALLYFNFYNRICMQDDALFFKLLRFLKIK